ncbi:SRPBCC domain-containing protein [Carboxylicivirga mesophila]|uniref:SRPBCC domain-containing protein n=2 Tax=Carboxylicivirga TaxID=1628153 RepID=A0A941F7W0_9BACT|nr:MULTISPECIES: START-like domain-containing protein [Carboxylicivirga]MBR8538252.1 SRPBCC domain-containing protein [Carboxylicivirga sediminis]MBS2213359.1 SRPBCC domain-containing protein [Carboxylicivirga mesophila]
MPTQKEKFELEYIIKTSPSILFSRLSSPSGLSEWFADDVNLKGKIFTFVWEGSEQQAEQVLRKENKMVRYHWLDDEDDKAFFEFRINVDDLTGETALVVIDFAEEDEKEDAIELWNNQIDELKHGLGSV